MTKLSKQAVSLYMSYISYWVRQNGIQELVVAVTPEGGLRGIGVSGVMLILPSGVGQVLTKTAKSG